VILQAEFYTRGVCPLTISYVASPRESVDDTCTLACKMPPRRQLTGGQTASNGYWWEMLRAARGLIVPAFHVAFVPFVITVGMLGTSPRPALVQLLSPM
jgi:hypothetical protein